MLTIGFVSTYSELQSKIERVLSFTNKKIRDISIACLIRHAEKHYETFRPFEASDLYLASIEDLCSKFRSSFLKAYFKMQLFYWKVDLNAPADKVLRQFEPFHRIVENPLKPDAIAALMPYLNNTEEGNDESRVEIFTNILFSCLGNNDGEGIHYLLTEYSKYRTHYLLDIFFSVAAYSPVAIKINLEHICLYKKEDLVDIFIDACLFQFAWLELYEVYVFVESMHNHRYKPLIQNILKDRLHEKLAKTKIL